MIKILMAMMLFAQVVSAQMISMGNHRKIFPASGGTAPTWDTTSGNSCNPVFTTTSTSYSCTLNASAGEMIVVSYFVYGAYTPSSVTVDGASTTGIRQQTLAGSFGTQGAYYLANATAGSHTATVNFASSTGSLPALYVATILGADTVSPIDGTPTGAVFTVASGANFACPSFTTTQTNDLIVAWGMNSGATNVTAGSGYTLHAGVAISGGSGGAYETQTGVTAGAYAPNFANGNGGHQGCIGFAVKHP